MLRTTQIEMMKSEYSSDRGKEIRQSTIFSTTHQGYTIRERERDENESILVRLIEQLSLEVSLIFSLHVANSLYLSIEHDILFSRCHRQSSREETVVVCVTSLIARSIVCSFLTLGDNYCRETTVKVSNVFKLIKSRWWWNKLTNIKHRTEKR